MCLLFSFIHLSIPSTHHRTRPCVFHRHGALPLLLPKSFPLSITPNTPFSLRHYILHSHTWTRAMVFRSSHMYYTIMLLSHNSLQTADGLLLSLSLTPLLPLLLSLAVSVFLPSPLITFRGKSILLGSGSKSCSSKHVICLSWLVWEGQEVVIKSRASCTTDRIQAEQDSIS